MLNVKSNTIEAVREGPAMMLSGALTIALALSAGANDDRLLLCRPQVAGEPALARAEAVTEAASRLKGRFLDYGAVCQDAGEGARAARRAGLAHAVVSRAEGTPEAARFQLFLADAESDALRAQRLLEVKPGQDAIRPVKGALGDLLRTLPPPPEVNRRHVAGWVTAGVGVLAVATGAYFASQASDLYRKADQATDPEAYTHYRQQAADKRRASAIALGVGGAAIATGLTLRFAF
jgi:hypothetical protein